MTAVRTLLPFLSKKESASCPKKDKGEICSFRKREKADGESPRGAIFLYSLNSYFYKVIKILFIR